MLPRLGVHVRELRCRAGLTQQQTAELAGISVASLRDLEQGRVTAPRAGTLRRLAEALQLPAEEADELIRSGQPGQRPADDLWLQVLGPLAVRLQDGSLGISSRTQRALLGALATSANSAVSQERLVEMIWASQPPADAIEKLRTGAYRLRRRLRISAGAAGAEEPELTVTGGSYQLTVGTHQLDLLLFRRLADAARQSRDRGDPDLACRLFMTATALWRGDPLAGDYPLCYSSAVTALSREWQAVVVTYAETATALGRQGEVLPLLRRAVAADPFHEAAGAQLLIALAAAGNAAEAVSRFHDLRQRLADEFGTDPGPELTHAYRLARQRRAGWRPLQPVPARRLLPGDHGEFTGRAAELRALHAMRREGATATAGAVLLIGGSPGVGKTALSVHFAHQLLAAGEHWDAQLYVDLGSTSGAPADPESALAKLLALLGVAHDQIPPDLAGRAAVFRDRLAGRRTLLLLDDAESEAQLLPLLPADPDSLTLVTSRRVLAVDGASMLRVDPLSPAEACELLARVIGGGRVADDPAAHTLGELCGHLPLALTLTARRLRARPDWSLPEIITRLREAPDRLRELGAGSDRLRASFDRSYRRLTADEQRVFQVLGRHPAAGMAGGVAVRDAGLPPRTSRHALARLVDEHLLTPLAHDRYQLPGLLHQYGKTLARAG